MVYIHPFLNKPKKSKTKRIRYKLQNQFTDVNVTLQSLEDKQASSYHKQADFQIQQQVSRTTLAELFASTTNSKFSGAGPGFC